MGVRYREYNPEQRYFTIIDPEEIKGHNPLLQAVHTFIDDYVSIKPFSEKVDNEEGGAPAVHPKMMLKIIFYSYAKGIYSFLISYDLVLCQGQTPFFAPLFYNITSFNVLIFDFLILSNNF